MLKIIQVALMLLIPSGLLAGLADEINQTDWYRVKETASQDKVRKHGLPDFKRVTFSVRNNTIVLDYVLSTEKKNEKEMTTEVSVSWGHDRFTYNEIASNSIKLYSVLDKTKPRYEIVVNDPEMTIKDLIDLTSITIRKKRRHN